MKDSEKSDFIDKVIRLKEAWSEEIPGGNKRAVISGRRTLVVNYLAAYKRGMCEEVYEGQIKDMEKSDVTFELVLRGMIPTTANNKLN